MINATEYVASLIERARKAQEIAEGFSQERVDHLIKAIVWNIVKPDNADKISKLAVEETQYGNYDSKYAKLMTKLKGALRDMEGKKSMGVIERNEEKGLIKIAKPVGVIGAVIPVTNPEATPVLKAIMAIKTRNAIVMSPHPKSKSTNTYIVNIIRDVLKKYDAPEDLVIGIEEPTLDISQELMKQSD